jgi:plastocyanin
MRRGALFICAAAAALLLTAVVAGCGSSGSSTVETTTITVGGITRTITTSKTSTAGGHSAGLQPDKPPQYAAPPEGAATQSGTVQIEYRNIAINPDAIKVKLGSTVRWTNYDPVEANVTSEGGPLKFKSKNLHEGESFEVQMTKPGVIHYQSTLHPVTQNGTIEVVQ